MQTLSAIETTLNAMNKQTQHKLKQAALARDYARKIGDKRLASRMSARVNAIVSQIAFGA